MHECVKYSDPTVYRRNPTMILKNYTLCLCAEMIISADDSNSSFERAFITLKLIRNLIVSP